MLSEEDYEIAKSKAQGLIYDCRGNMDEEMMQAISMIDVGIENLEREHGTLKVHELLNYIMGRYIER